jgi:GNT-I family
VTGLVVTMTVHNRPAYLRETLASWARVRGVDQVEMMFRCEPGCPEAVHECVTAGMAGWSAGFAVRVNRERLGVLSNPWHALEAAFGRGVSFAVLAEEDTPVADDVLEYFTWAASVYRADRQVLAVCAHHLNGPAGGPADVYRVGEFSPIVWGTWADRWASLLRDTWDHDYSRKGWDWAISALLAETGRVTIAPGSSRSQHIGEHGGAHCTPGYYPQTVSASFRPHYDPQVYREAAT